MSESIDPLPNDIAVLQALVVAARAQRDAALTERDAAIMERDRVRSQNQRLEHLLQKLRRLQFGRRSEQLDADQLHLAFEDIEQAIAAIEADADKRDAAPSSRHDPRLAQARPHPQRGQPPGVVRSPEQGRP